MTEAATPTPPANNDESQQGGATTQEEPFDLDRAMKTINTLRSEIKNYKASLKDLETLRTEKQQRDQAQLSEQEKLAQRLSQMEAELKFEREEKADRILDYEIEKRASQLGIVDTEVARLLVRRGNLELDDKTGQPTNLDEVLNELVKTKPYLTSQSPIAGQTTAGQAVAGRMNTTNPATKGTEAANGKRVYRASELRDHAFFEANKKDIGLAMREGRFIAE